MRAVSKTSAVLATMAMLAVAVPVYSQSGSDAGGGAQSSGKQSAGDDAIAKQVYDKLNADPIGYYKHVTVRADKGVVTLGGLVWSDEDLNRAKRIAATVPGVTQVVDRMTIERGPRR
jgi:osmotically-inducible protein OsmY